MNKQIAKPPKSSKLSLYLLYTNEGNMHVWSTEKRLYKALARYTRKRQNKGVSISDIKFCWSPMALDVV